MLKLDGYLTSFNVRIKNDVIRCKTPADMATYKGNIFCQTYQKLKMTSTAIHFATVALNTDSVTQPKELTVAQIYTILAEQNS